MEECNTKADQIMWQQEKVCFTIILGEGLFRTDPLKHYRNETATNSNKKGEGGVKKEKV